MRISKRTVFLIDCGLVQGFLNCSTSWPPKQHQTNPPLLTNNVTKYGKKHPFLVCFLLLLPLHLYRILSMNNFSFYLMYAASYFFTSSGQFLGGFAAQLGGWSVPLVSLWQSCYPFDRTLGSLRCKSPWKWCKRHTHNPMNNVFDWQAVIWYNIINII